MLMQYNQYTMQYFGLAASEDKQRQHIETWWNTGCFSGTGIKATT
jgi:hypothetical protein